MVARTLLTYNSRRFVIRDAFPLQRASWNTGDLTSVWAETEFTSGAADPARLLLVVEGAHLYEGCLSSFLRYIFSSACYVFWPILILVALIGLTALYFVAVSFI